ncbi:SAM-dependent methyltransferase [Azorhizobium doebereinerae]|uniref:SAM-dependent methyltransferase n=1 Tax=Azorhizobium doebereinerae TaxID=281091 RepID=UPI00040A4B3A|nr:cyclopropane-fatty-acyl-phospholipid synthase family protein [Azorhizobium doebereinerae]
MSVNSDSRHVEVSEPSGRMARGIGPYVLKRLLSRLESGSLTVVFPSGARLEHRTARPGPEATLAIHDWRAFRRFAARGGVGFAEAYMAQEWTSPDVAALIELAGANVARLEEAFGGSLPVRLFRRIGHALKANTKAGSRRNIAFHYDLGNDFYRLWLDPSMTYSSALYAAPDQSLEDAQQAKLTRIAELLELGGGSQRVLEIGCGWGALASRLARAGAHVTGLTLSQEQLAYARALVAEQGLAERVDLRLQDYRDVDGTFDRIVSIEMLEAVGEQYWPAYFETLKARLAPGGVAVLQVITIDEARYEDYRISPDFIQHYVFPGGMLPTKAIMAEQVARAGLRLEAVEPFGASYALTLAEWRRRFHAAWPEVERLGFNATFRRLWDYYLAYCEGGFRSGVIDVALYKIRA